MIILATEEKLDRARQMIWHMDVKKFGWSDWTYIGMIMYRLGFEYSDWYDWSRNDPRFKEHECQYFWKRFSDYEGQGGHLPGMPKLVSIYKNYCARKV